MSEDIKHPFKVGDIFSTSWGYEQTNVEFYEVVAVTPASVKVQQLAAAMADDERGKGLVPKPGVFTYFHRDILRHPESYEALCAFDGCHGDSNHEVDGWSIDGDLHRFESVRDETPILKRVQGGPERDQYYLKMSSWGRHARPWSGKPKFDTLAFGYPGH